MTEFVGMFRTREPGRTFENWGEFVDFYCPDLGKPAASLCNVLVSNNAWGSSGSQQQGFPWITAVIGPGATSDNEALEPMRDLISRAVNAVPAGSARVLTAEYAMAMVSEHLGVAPTRLTIDSNADAGDEGLELGMLLHASVRLARAYFAVKSHGVPVVGHRESEFADLPIMAVARFDIEDEFLSPASAALSEALLQCSQESLRAVLEEAIQNLRPTDDRAARIAYVHVRALAENCWSTLIASYYRGWSDLLWGLFMHGKNFPPTHADRGPRPLAMSMEEAGNTVRKMLLDRTRESWPIETTHDTTNEEAAAGRRSRTLHDRVAESLAAQVRYFRGFPEKSHAKPPPASAFVTGFDVELEIALLRAGQPFVMALPFEVIPHQRPVWLGCYVPARPEGSLDSVLAPAAANWFVLGGPNHSIPPEATSGPEIEDWRGNLPVVVRLTGSPLVRRPDLDEVPELEDEIAELLELAKDQHLEAFHHAVLVDETVALSHTAAMLDDKTARSKQSLAGHDYGLPAELIWSRADRGYFRYWLLLGVQLADSAVRHTLTMQLAMRSNPSRSSRPRSNGLAVNERLSGEAEEALRKLGIDRLRSTVDCVEDELAHYAVHVDAVHVGSAVDPGTRQRSRRGSIGSFPSTENDRCPLRFPS